MSSLDPERLVEHLQSLLESGPGVPVGQTLELFLRCTERVRVALPGSDSGETLARSSEAGMAVRRFLDQDRQAGFATVNLCDIEHYIKALRSADLDPVPVGAGLGPGVPSREQSGSSPWLDSSRETCPSEAELSGWLAEAVEQVEAAAGRITPIRVQQGWVESGKTAEAILNSRGLRAGRFRPRTWAALQVVSEAGGELFHRPRLLVGERAGSLPDVEPVLERLQAFPFFHKQARLDPGAALVFLPEAAATLIQTVVTLFHGPGGRAGEPVGSGWCLADDPHREGMPFGGRFDDTGTDSHVLNLADGSHCLATLGEEGHAWRRSFRDPPQRTFSNIVVQGSGDSRPDHGFLVSELRILRLSDRRCLAVAHGNRLEGGAAAADGGRIRFAFNPWRIPARICGSSGRPRNTAVGISTPELVLEPGKSIQFL
jgi:hypothetical protein